MEIWRSIQGYEGCYEVSDHGRVRSLDRTIVRTNGRPLRVKGRVLKQVTDKSGYSRVSLSRVGVKENAFVHHLVLEAFVGPRMGGTESRHLNGDPSDNGVSNLLWGTKKENAKDRIRHGNQLYGERNSEAKLNREAARAIRYLAQKGEIPQRVLADVFGVSQQTVSKIKTGDRWHHV